MYANSLFTSHAVTLLPFYEQLSYYLHHALFTLCVLHLSSPVIPILGRTKYWLLVQSYSAVRLQFPNLATTRLVVLGLRRLESQNSYQVETYISLITNLMQCQQDSTRKISLFYYMFQLREHMNIKGLYYKVLNPTLHL